MTRDQWGEIGQRLLKTVGQNNYTTWIKPLEPKHVEDGICTLEVPTNFFGNYVSQNFSDLILHEISAIMPSVQRLKFALAPRTPVMATAAAAAPVAPRSQAAAPQATATAAAKGAANSALNTAPLDPRFSFDNFVVGKPNELAHAAARRVAEGGPVTFNPLFLYGGVGLGKTHLMHAIARELGQRQPEMNVL